MSVVVSQGPAARAKGAWTAATCATLAASTLAFGAVYPWAYWPLIGAAAVLGVTGLWLGTRSSPLAVALGLAAIALALCLQLVRMPTAILTSVSPATHRFLMTWDVAYTHNSPAGPPNHALSINPSQTLLGAACFGAFAVYLVGAVAALDRTAARNLTRGLAALGVLVAVTGIVGRARTTELVYGFWRPLDRGDVFGPFVNRNHFAGWMIMAVSIAAGQFCRTASGVAGRNTPGWRSWLRWLSTPQASELLLVGFGLLVMTTSLALSASRSGITFGLVAIGVVAATGIRRSTDAVRGVVAAACLAGSALAAVAWVGADRLAARFAAASWTTLDGRLGAWWDAVAVARDFPIAGTGLNTYSDAMMLYQRADPHVHYTAAHNEYLQLAAEGGLLLGVPILLSVVFTVRGVRARFRDRAQPPGSYWLRLGAVTGIMGIALQSLVDFSLQIPANAMLFTTLVAVALHDGRMNDAGR